MNLNSGPKNSPLCQIWAWSSNYLENSLSFLAFSSQKMMWHTENKRLPWQHLITMVIDKIGIMTVKGVKLKSESFFSISYGVLELWRKNPKDSAPLVQIGLIQLSEFPDFSLTFLFLYQVPWLFLTISASLYFPWLFPDFLDLRDSGNPV